MNLIEEIKINSSIAILNGVFYLSPTGVNNPAEELYLEMRKKEGRLYDDALVKELPEIPYGHKYSNEWRLRKISSQKLIQYLEGVSSEKNILDLGCGNGWMANKLSELRNSFVMGVDVNRLELEQAARVFLPKRNLAFVYADIIDRKDSAFKFDFIILSAAIQYFSDLNSLLKNLLSKLNENGEIHIIDSPFYTEKDMSTAKERTTAYYSKLGFPEMTAFYHHHMLSEILQNFRIEILYNPKRLTNRIKRGISKNYSPFYWIRVK